ncbi:MAG: DUF1761 domain-containing protein [Gemmatimonadota bacterium]
MSLGHWPAILVSALAAWLIGALWYSPLLFAKAWVKAHGYTPEKLASMRANAPRAYAGSLAAFVLMAFVLHLFLNHLGVETAGGGAVWGFHAWLGFALPIGFTANLYSDKPISTFLIDAGYQLVYLTAMGAILGAWH